LAALQILEPCHSSIAYHPPNPWTMGILSLLAEIYNLPNLKMNLKFDIEVLNISFFDSSFIGLVSALATHTNCSFEISGSI